MYRLFRDFCSLSHFRCEYWSYNRQHNNWRRQYFANFYSLIVSIVTVGNNIDFTWTGKNEILDISY